MKLWLWQFIADGLDFPSFHLPKFILPFPPLGYEARIPLLYKTNAIETPSSSASLCHPIVGTVRTPSIRAGAIDTVASFEILLGIAGQSGFWGAYSRYYSPKIVSSSPAYCSPFYETTIWLLHASSTSSSSCTTLACQPQLVRLCDRHCFNQSPCIESVPLFRARPVEQ